MTRRQTVLLAIAIGSVFAAIATAQYWSGDDRERRVHYTENGPGQPSVRVDEDTMSTAREVISHSTDVPAWTNAPGFEKDAFTFCRIRFISAYGPRRYSHGSWITDFPDSDMNLSFRLQQMTSMSVSPDGRFLRLNNTDLYHYPWIYMVEPGRLVLDESEVNILRDYLLNGGFLMADDFWGEVQWQNFYQEMKKVFPDREFVELEMTHPIFHTVFDINVPKQKLQTPNWYQAYLSLQPGHPEYGVTWEERAGEGSEEMHVRAITDDRGRIMVIATHNCDNGDGWEREGQNDDFFRSFSEKRAFPLGINIIVYAMTH
jgi:hypothetical protein